MPESNFQPAAVEGHEGSPQVSPIYAYAVMAEDLSDAVFLTSWDSQVKISGMPARYNAADPQSFTPTQINHTEITKRAEFDRHSFNVVARFDTAGLDSGFVTASAVPLLVEVIRIARGTLDDSDSVAEWGVDTYVVQTWIVTGKPH